MYIGDSSTVHTLHVYSYTCVQLTCERELAGGFSGGSDQSLNRPVNKENEDGVSTPDEGQTKTIEYLQQLIYSLRATAEGLVLYSTS